MAAVVMLQIRFSAICLLCLEVIFADHVSLLVFHLVFNLLGVFGIGTGSGDEFAHFAADEITN